MVHILSFFLPGYEKLNDDIRTASAIRTREHNLIVGGDEITLVAHAYKSTIFEFFLIRYCSG